jgi:hypothetical protein
MLIFVVNVYRKFTTKLFQLERATIPTIYTRLAVSYCHAYLLRIDNAKSMS